MKTQTKLLVENNLKELKLSAMLRNYEQLLREVKVPEEFLLELTMLEIEGRVTRRQAQRIKESKFPLIKTLDSFDFSAINPVAAQEIKSLCSGTYLLEYRNVLFLGGSGTGKTHAACGLAYEACKSGKRVRFTTICSLMNELVEARKGLELQRILERFARYDLLVVDEVGYVPLSKEGSDLIFQLFSMRHEKASIIFTTNLPFQEWTQVFGEANLTVALLDRVTHRAHIIEMNGESYRFKETIKNHSISKK